MNISREKIDELRTIIREEYGHDYSLEEMEQIAKNLLGVYDLLAKINYKNYNEKEK